MEESNIQHTRLESLHGGGGTETGLCRDQKAIAFMKSLRNGTIRLEMANLSMLRLYRHQDLKLEDVEVHN